MCRPIRQGCTKAFRLPEDRARAWVRQEKCGKRNKGEEFVIMKVICCICQKLISEIDDGQDLVSYGMHEECGLEYYRELDLTPLPHAV
jgi:hypothetical protein